MNGESLEARLRELLDDGKKIEAIKAYREETGADLATAKAAVDALDGSDLPPDDSEGNDALTDEVVALLGRGEMIQAIKLVREQTGANLADAKRRVEAIGTERGLLAESGAGCFGGILLLLATGIGAAALVVAFI